MSKMFTDDAMTWFAHAFQSGLVPSENVWIIISWISFFFVSFPPFDYRMIFYDILAILRLPTN